MSNLPVLENEDILTAEVKEKHAVILFSKFGKHAEQQVRDARGGVLGRMCEGCCQQLSTFICFYVCSCI